MEVVVRDEPAMHVGLHKDDVARAAVVAVAVVAVEVTNFEQALVAVAVV